MRSHSVKLILNIKDVVLFQLITHWVRVSVSTMGYAKTVATKIMGNLDEAVVLMIKIMYTCLSSVLHLITLLRIWGSFKFSQVPSYRCNLSPSVS